ncbi:hypothetical protein [Paracraurococcus lichenis]|uniref:Uncharacterized protein n=1 Tax=Paracraurococcus lichenis TaxID=3064888 RepID=A0ABT9E9V6_9PROT|nr:hypothetical protein [Paracraurococcus sp. LOR1-02]MDO9712936.1 hypothetical protein [Paracraurococcus sp. LOR1-02]
MAGLDETVETLGMPAVAAAHPEEMRAEADLRLGSRVALRAAARMTPAGLLAAGIMASAVLLSAALLVRALRPLRRW